MGTKYDIAIYIKKAVTQERGHKATRVTCFHNGNSFVLTVIHEPNGVATKYTVPYKNIEEVETHLKDIFDMIEDDHNMLLTNSWSNEE